MSQCNLNEQAITPILQELLENGDVNTDRFLLERLPTLSGFVKLGHVVSVERCSCEIAGVVHPHDGPP